MSVASAAAYNSRMEAQRDVLIIGGGIIGLTTAYILARDGVRVTVVDKGEFGREASWAGAGIIPPGNADRAVGAMDRLRAESSRMFAELSAELRQRTGQDNGYSLCGGAELASGLDEADVATWRAEGVDYQALSCGEWPRLERAFAQITEAGFYLPSMAQVRNPWHLRALITACATLGVEMIPECAVVRLQCLHSRRVECAVTENRTLCAGRFLVTAGAWTDPLLTPFGWRPGIFPVRGQMVLFRPVEPLFRTILLRGKCYLVPRADGRVLAGSTEEEVGFAKATTEDAIAMLTAMARSLVPALCEAPIETTWCGLRPATHNGLPYLGRVPGLDNLFVASGHFRAGIQLSPATGLVMSQLLQDQPTTIPLDAFAPDRVSAAAYHSAFHS